MTDITPTSILSLFDTNKEQRQSFVANLMAQLETGNVDPLKVHYQIKCAEKIIKELGESKDYREYVMSAAEKYGSKEFEFSFSKCKIGEVGTKYDYSQCGDTELEAWVIQAASLKEKIDSRQKLLQSVPVKGMLITNEETGETSQVFPPSKSSTTFITMTLK